MKRLLITGITGFAGPHLAALLLNRGYEVFGLSRRTNGMETDILDVIDITTYSAIRFVQGDIEDAHSVDRIFQNMKFDGVFHLAAQSHPPTSFRDPFGTSRANSVGTNNIAEAILNHQPECRLHFCSTSEVYGAVPAEKGPITEGFPIEPINPYAVSKAAADMFIRERAWSVKAPFFVTRAFSHTGPRRGNTFSISSDAFQLIKIKKGMQKPVIKVGTLSSRRAVIDVRDCVNAYALLMEEFKPGEAYNVGGDTVYSMGEILDKMITILGLEGRVEKEVDPSLVRPIDIPVQICNCDKLKTATSWTPMYDMEETLEDLLSYWDRKLS